MRDKTLEFYKKYVWAVSFGGVIAFILPFVSFFSSMNTEQKTIAGIQSFILGTGKIYLIIYCVQFIIYFVFLGTLLNYVDWMQYNWGIIAIIYFCAIVVLHFMLFFTPVCMTVISTNESPLSTYSVSDAKLSPTIYILISTLITASIFLFPLGFKL